jgi:hypothetical protein
MGLNLRRRKPTKRYLPSGLSAEAFFAALDKDNVRYVLLRWWKDFPKLDPGEDLDILVHGDEYEKVEELLSTKPSGIKCDLYGHDNRNSNRKKTAPYFPPNLACDLLATRVRHKKVVYVPSAKLYFASLAYHAIFHKGVGSGLAGFQSTPSHNRKPEHDYAEELAQAATDCGVSVDIEASTLYRWLVTSGYSPNLDMLSYLVKARPELASFAELPHLEKVLEEGELYLLVIRQLAMFDSSYLNKVLKLLRKRRMELLGVVALDDCQVRAASRLRGGNWSRGPYPVSGGPPHTIIIGYDWYPEKPEDLAREPLLQNQRLRLIKDEARRAFNKWRWFRTANVVHSPDNELEALEYLRSIDQNLCKKTMLNSQARKARFSRRKHEFIKNLSQGRRSRTDLIFYQGSQAVLKSYRVGYERFCSREIEARTLFSEKIPMPRILSVEDGVIIMEFVDQAHPIDLLKLTHPEKCKLSEFCVRCVRSFWAAGYFQADFDPRNFLIAHDNSISLIDFEFLQPYGTSKPRFADAYEFCGVPVSAQEYDIPVGPFRKNMMNHRNWRALPFGTYIAPLLLESHGEAMNAATPFRNYDIPSAQING